MLKQKKRGQTTIEYIVIITIILAAFLAMQSYLKRGLQGRWKSAVDDLGEQYDPGLADSSVRHTLDSTTNTQIIAIQSVNGAWTTRTDATTSVDKKIGSTAIGGY